MSDAHLTTRMTRTERDQLTKPINRRTRLARQDIETRQAQLLADVESQLAARYSSRHEAWVDITKRAEKAVAEADAEIAARCQELGIPENFRPSISIGWWDRGENADRQRRAELRKVAVTKLEAERPRREARDRTQRTQSSHSARWNPPSRSRFSKPCPPWSSSCPASPYLSSKAR